MDNIKTESFRVRKTYVKYVVIAGIVLLLIVIPVVIYIAYHERAVNNADNNASYQKQITNLINSGDYNFAEQLTIKHPGINYVTNQTKLAYAYISADQPSKAMSIYNLLASKNELQYNSAVTAANLAISNKNYQLVVKYYKDAIRLEPKTSPTYSADIQYYKGQINQYKSMM